MTTKAVLPTAQHSSSNYGFTLIELLISMVISMIIITGIYSAYRTQEKSQIVQSQVIKMQQSLRSLMTFLSSEIRLAGYNPEESEGIGIVQADIAGIIFTCDKNGDGDTDDDNEYIEYALEDGADSDNDGQVDSGVSSLCRNTDDTTTDLQPLADNIVAVEFLYVLEDDTADGVYNPTTTLAPSSTAYDSIRAITISILVRSSHSDSSFVNTSSYTTGSGAIWGPYDDNYRRRILTTTVKLRNYGLGS